jgi:protein-disulfide isomerase
MPYLVGATAVVVLSFLYQGGGGGQSVGSVQARVPDAFSNLPQADQQALLQLAQRAANQYMADPTGQMNAAVAAAAAVNPVPGAQPSLPPGFPGDAAARALAAAQIQGGALSPGLSNKRLSADEFRAVGSEAAVLKVVKGKQPVYAFEDPNCPVCQEFARKSRTLGSDYALTVVPVGFQGGGRERAAAALCSKDPVAAWEQVMRGLPVDGEVCDAGLKKVDANNQLFLRLGFDATPTVLAPNGQVFRGSAETPILLSWLKSNER